MSISTWSHIYKVESLHYDMLVNFGCSCQFPFCQFQIFLLICRLENVNDVFVIIMIYHSMIVFLSDKNGLACFGHLSSWEAEERVWESVDIFSGAFWLTSYTRGQYTQVHINALQILYKALWKNVYQSRVIVRLFPYCYVCVCVLQWSSSSRSGDISRSDSSGRRTNRVIRRNGGCCRSFNWRFRWQWYEPPLYHKQPLFSLLTHSLNDET